MITWPESIWMCFGKEWTTKGTWTQERAKGALWYTLVIGTFLHIERTRGILENSYFVAPKALGFVFMALAVRGVFNR